MKYHRRCFATSWIAGNLLFETNTMTFESDIGAPNNKIAEGASDPDPDPEPDTQSPPVISCEIITRTPVSQEPCTRTATNSNNHLTHRHQPLRLLAIFKHHLCCNPLKELLCLPC